MLRKLILLGIMGFSLAGCGNGSGGGSAMSLPQGDAFVAAVSRIVATSPEDAEPLAVDSIVPTSPDEAEPQSL